MPTTSQKVKDYFELTDPKQPDGKRLKKMTKAELIKVIEIMAERWLADTTINPN